MPFNRPTLSTINNRIDADITSAVSTNSPLLPRSVLRVLSKVFAGAIHLLYGFCQWMSKQIFPDTADSENLERWCGIWNVTRSQATYAFCYIVVEGVDGSLIPTGTRWISTDLIEYESLSDVNISGSSITIPIYAVTPGEIGNVLENQILSLSAPMPGLSSSATVTTPIVDGIDAETDEELLARLLSRIQEPPHGGNRNDYITWAKETPVYRVTRAWAYENWNSPGGVGVTFLLDNEDNPIPGEGAVDAVQAYIETKRPLCSTVYVFAPTAVMLDFNIAVTPNTEAVKIAIQNALNTYLKENGTPGATLYLSKLNEAISSASGEEDHTLINPSANVVLTNTQFAVLGNITWGE